MLISVAVFDLGRTLVQDNRRWVAGAQATLSELKEHHIRLGILSNTRKLSREQVRAQLPEDFDFGDFEAELILLSSEVGWSKPDRRLFLEAIDRADASPSECLFCTEEASHTLAAQSVGILSYRVLPPPDSDIASLATFLAAADLL